MDDEELMPRRGLARKYTEELFADWDAIGAHAALCSYPDISDRARWEGLPADIRALLVAEGERYLDYTWPLITAADYMEFSENGNRSHFQDKQFARRTSLNALVLAECVENKGRFMKQILNGLFLMLEEGTWCLPAHNAYIRDTKQFPLPDYERPVIDLFQAESAAIAAVAEYLLRPAFARISPFISKNVNLRLRERIFEPYLNTHFWWMGNGKEPVNNWTVWCTQNVLLATFTRAEGLLNAETKKRILAKAVRSIDYFLDEYGEDGCCDEGAQYYSHAGLTLFNCLEILKELSGGTAAGIFDETLIHNIADYILKVYIGGGCYVNFADCSPRAGRRGAREFLFGKATGNHALMAFAAADYREAEDKLICDEHNLYYRVQQAFAHGEMMAYPAEPLPAQDVWFESVGLMVARDGVYTLAAKAGDNADSHNHNDVGSFTVYKHEQPFVIDLGVETYTQKTFSPQRYEIWTMQSQYHNLPSFGTAEQAAALFAETDGLTHTLDGFSMQKDGADYGASAVVCELGAQRSSLSMDIAGAYPDAGVRHYTRSLVLKKGKGIELSDAYEGEGKAVLSLMFYEKPTVTAHSADESKAQAETLTLQVGALGTVSIEGAGAVRIETCPITDERLQGMWKHDCYRVLVEMKEQSLHLRLN